MRLAIIASVLLLTSCSLFDSRIINRTTTVEKEMFHQVRSKPVYVSIPHMDLLTPKTKEEFLVDNYLYAIYTWEEYLELAAIIKKLMLKIDQQNLLLCHYRRTLKEEMCVGILPPLPVQPKPIITVMDN